MSRDKWRHGSRALNGTTGPVFGTGQGTHTLKCVPLSRCPGERLAVSPSPRPLQHLKAHGGCPAWRAGDADRPPLKVFNRTIETQTRENKAMVTRAIKLLEKKLRDEGKLPRSMREVRTEFRNSGKILPPDQMADQSRQRRRSYERKTDQPVAITPVEYSGLQEAYDHFNAVLFGGKLLDVFIVYQRRAHSAGYFAPDRFVGRTAVGGKHELALNPDAFIGRSDEWITSVLVHEMA